MTEKKKDVLQPVDDEARRQAKALVRSARHASLGTLDPVDGSPAVSRVSLSTAMNGDPCFFISRLSGHFGNLEADPRCSVLVGEPGKGDPLAHPRMTIIGHAAKVVGDELAAIKSRYLLRHPKAQLYAEFPDFAMWRVTPRRASLNGGFGRAFALQADDLECLGAVSDLERSEAGAVAHMNADHADALDRYAMRIGADGTGWRLASLDPEGLDLARGEHMARLWFEKPLASAAELRPALVALAKA